MYGMKPNEYWQCTPKDIFTFVAVNRPPEQVGLFEKKQLDKMVKKLEEFENGR